MAHAAYFDIRRNSYITIMGKVPVEVHPSSVLFKSKKKPAVLLFNTVIMTSKNYMRDVVAVNEQWVKEASPQAFGGTTVN